MHSFMGLHLSPFDGSIPDGSIPHGTPRGTGSPQSPYFGQEHTHFSLHTRGSSHPTRCPVLHPHTLPFLPFPASSR